MQKPTKLSPPSRPATLPAQYMDLLSRLLLPLRDTTRPVHEVAGLASMSDNMSKEQFAALAALAQSNHVIIRAFSALAHHWRQAGNVTRAEWAETALAEEHARIHHAVPFLRRICEAFQTEGLPATVIKSLDHWPDLGSDLDLYSSAAPEDVLGTMRKHFGATLSERSWGDKLAQKWNFVVPDLPELVEFHIGRLGQTGEQSLLAAKLHARARVTVLGEERLPVTSPSDRLMISTLQRMYRHFYFRLCDIIDSATLVQSGQVDFGDLQRAATACGIWPGVATYLAIVSDYIVQYGNAPLDLPVQVRRAARFGGSSIYVGREFLRVPILPQSIKLYGSQLAGLVSRGSLRSASRLSLLPWLASAAWVEQKRTGSDKGIW